MYTGSTSLIAFVLALSLAGNVQAGTSTWNDAGDHLWGTVANWSLFPTFDDWVKIRYGAPGPTLVSEGAEALKISVGYEDDSALTVDGGSLTTVEDLALGWNSGSGTLNMISGVINVGRDFEVGRAAQGTANIIGGTITVGDDLMIPEGGTTNTALVNLDGGVVIVSDDLTMAGTGAINIKAGTLILEGDMVSTVQGYIDNGWITAYGSAGDVLVDFDLTNPGKTTVTAIPEPATLALLGLGALVLRRRRK